VSAIFASANVALGQGDILGIPVTRWDISDEYFVEFTFYPRALEKEPVKSIKALVPKKEVVLIVELKKPEGMGSFVPFFFSWRPSYSYTCFGARGCCWAGP
jgi:hypothetical protein